MKPKISVMVHTASYDNFLQNQGINSYFHALIDNLSRQNFKEFELIFIDTFYEENKGHFDYKGIQVKHVPIHKNHRYWYDQGYCYISAAKNTGILYADGELLVTFDDAEFFPPHLLEKYWQYYKEGCCMLAVHKRLKNLASLYPLEGETYINDHRILNAKQPVICHKHGNWAYAGTSFSLKDALKLNGFNEKMDGCKSLEDCDFGNRLVMLGREFTTDTDGFLYILDHKSYGDMTSTHWDGIVPDDVQKAEFIPTYKKKIENLIAIENYGMLKCAEELYELKANRTPINDQHLKIIKRETLKYRHFDPLDVTNADKMKIWLGVPNFDLVQERVELRESQDWIWEKV